MEVEFPNQASRNAAWTALEDANITVHEPFFSFIGAGSFEKLDVDPSSSQHLKALEIIRLCGGQIIG
jgi:hypothetical protein